MRQVFASQRLENVEAVAELLRAEGIQVQVRNGRSWRGHRRGNFSYDQRKPTGDLPSVWIVNADDQPRGRQLLRQMGLLESSRELPKVDGPIGYGVASVSGRAAGVGKRIKLGALALIVVVFGLAAYGLRRAQLPTSAAPAVVQTPAPAAVEAIVDPGVFRIDVPRALAVQLLGAEIAARKPATACVGVDGDSAPEDVLAELAQPGVEVHVLAGCPAANALRVSVSHYMTDGSGSGTVQRRVDDAATTLDVRREGRSWHVGPALNRAAGPASGKAATP